MRRKEREVTDVGEIRGILDECKVCRLGLSDEDGIYMVPMNYGYREQDGKLILYFHGAKEGKKVEMIRKDPRAGFEMDCGHGLQEGEKACQYSYYFASVIGTGSLSWKWKHTPVNDMFLKFCALIRESIVVQ